MPTSSRAIVALACLALTLPPASADESERHEPGHREDAVPAPAVPVDRDLQPRSPGAIVMAGQHQSVQVNVDSGGMNIVGDAGNEPSIAIDPTNPDVIVIAWRQFDTIASDFRQAGYAYSRDAGATWTFPGVLDPGQFRSDPVLATDSAGNFYYYSLSSVTTGEYFVSIDGGVHWTDPIPAPAGDKNWQTIDTGNDNIYADWNSQFTCCAPGTDFTRSTDGAMSFGGPWVLSIHPKWGTLDVGPDNELYVAGSTLDQDGHVLLRSDNPGNALVPAFDLATMVDLGGTTDTGGAPNPGGLQGQVWVAVDRSGEATSGNVYLLASVDPPGSDPVDVHFVRSIDGGETWTEPMAVNDNPGDGSYQWFGTMSVSPEGRIDVVWNDTRGSAPTTSVLTYAYSTDAGDSFSAGLPVSPAFDSTLGWPQQNKIGDYYHMISSTDDAALAWSATFNGEQDVYFLRVGDCNANGVHDSVDITSQASNDINANGIPDECEPDCNGNDIPDSVDISGGESDDCNGNFVPDECDISDGDSEDCNENGVLDECDVTFDFETDPGFTVGAEDDTATTGVWERVDPVGTEAQPEDDHTPDPGSFCFVTGQGEVGGGLGDNDVDGGKTTLFTPVLDLSGAADPQLGYWRWFSNDTGGAANQDVFIVDVSNDGGQSWVNAETVGPSGPETSGGWFYHAFRVADFVAPTSQVQLRFVAADNGAGSLVEAAIDDFVIIDCETCALPMPGEVQNLLLGRSSPAVAELTWDPLVDATTYDLYRSQDPQALDCYLDGLTSPSTGDDGFLPPLGEVLYYVPTAVNCAGESTLGEERIASTPCP